MYEDERNTYLRDSGYHIVRYNPDSKNRYEIFMVISNIYSLLKSQKH